MRPGRALITQMRLARKPASRRSCVTSSTVGWCSHPELLQDRPQLLARELVERAERLVEQQQARLVDQRAAEIGALQHAAGKLPGIAAAKALQADLLQQRIGLVAEFGVLAVFLNCDRYGSTIFSGSMMFCSIVSHGSMVGFWNAMPMRKALAPRLRGRRR